MKKPSTQNMDQEKNMNKLKDLKASDLMSNQEDAIQFQKFAQEAHKEKYQMNEMDKLIDQVAREMWEEEQKQEQEQEKS